MKKYIFNLIVLFTCLISCKKTEKDYPVVFDNVKTIKVDIEKEPVAGNFNEYFSSSKIIPLETNENSIFSKIDRISLFDNKIYILDRKLNSVFVFNDEGRFLNKIQKIGRGPQEYISLTDFSIDENKKQIILYTDSPYKILIYNNRGEFIKENSLSKLYSNIGVSGNKIVLLNNMTNRKHMLFEYNLDTGTKKSFLPTNDIDDFFSNFAVGTPNITKDKNVHISFPYSDIIYEFNEKGFKPKYQIDFGKRKFPNKVYNQEKDIFGVYNYAIDKNYGWGITNFREYNDFVTFSYHLNKLVIYSKKTNTSKVFKFFNKDKVTFLNYFAHDGNDNKLIAICQAESFKKRIDRYERLGNDYWNSIPDSIKEIALKITKNDNPLLIIYTFKDV